MSIKRPHSNPKSDTPAATRGEASLPRARRDTARTPRVFEIIIPGREEILAALTAEAIPVDDDRLAECLALRPEQRDGFDRRVAAMARDGQILRNRKGAILMADRADLIAGRVEAHPDGYGFVATGTGDDLYLQPKEMNQVLHGDRVMVRAMGVDRRGRREAVIVEVLERAQQRVVGRLYCEHGVWFVVAADRRIAQDILIEPDSLDMGGGKRGRAGPKPAPDQVVTVELSAQPSRYAQPIGRIVEVLGTATDPGMEIEIALRKHQLPFEFDRAVEREIKRLPDEVRKADLAGREDLRALPFVTIDGETARDFDDAVYACRHGRGFALYVAIADVSHYVRDGSAIDEAARERSTSVYFPRRVIPMLPEALSNDLCSLNPNVDRLAMVCEMAISRAGKIGDYRFYPAVFRSHARLTYNQVAATLYDEPRRTDAVPVELQPHLDALDQVFRALLGTRAGRGAIDFETAETILDFDSGGKIAAIRATIRNDAHRLIEECMLAANVCAAQYLADHKHPTLYRVHEGPTPEKLDSLRQFLKSFNLALGGGDKPSANDYARVLEQVKARPESSLLQTVLLRSLRQAIYSPINVGHFGLAYPAYAHFTSPIRRYPDLLVHRAIKAVLAGEQYKPFQYREAPADWKALGELCSQHERRADEASRDVVQWLKCFYMRDRVDDEFDGVISAVTGFGIFVTLNDLFVEGLVHISELGRDYFHLDAARHELRGERSGQAFRLAGSVRVRVVRVDLERARIDFQLAEATA